MNGEAIAWSPDAQNILGGCGVRPPPPNEFVRKDKGEHLCMWDASGRRLYPLGELDVQKSHLRARVSARFSSDGQLLAILSTEGLQLWDVAGARLARTLAKWECYPESCIVPSAFVIGPDGTIWTLTTKLERWRADGTHAPAPHPLRDAPVGQAWDGLVLDPKRDFLAVSRRGGTALFTLSNGLWQQGVIGGQGIFFDPRGTELFVANDNRIAALDLASRRELFSFPNVDTVNIETFTADGQELMIGYHQGDFFGRWSGGSMRLWSATTGRAIATIRPVNGTDDSYVMTEGPDARIEFFGDAGRKHAFCRSGPLTLPFEACAERFEVKGLLEKQRKGDLSYLDP